MRLGPERSRRARAPAPAADTFFCRPHSRAHACRLLNSETVQRYLQGDGGQTLAVSMITGLFTIAKDVRAAAAVLLLVPPASSFVLVQNAADGLISAECMSALLAIAKSRACRALSAPRGGWRA